MMCLSPTKTFLVAETPQIMLRDQRLLKSNSLLLRAHLHPEIQQMSWLKALRYLRSNDSEELPPLLMPKVLPVVLSNDAIGTALLSGKVSINSAVTASAIRSAELLTGSTVLET